ncbi:MAG: FAD-binding oxidoreductase [Ignavibacteria bacterium]|nr:FAD-binding oxidoreductase [Ignavibacteria bacterium]
MKWNIESWGRYTTSTPADVQLVNANWNPVTTEPKAPYLAHGLGRSYGDSCLNNGGTILLTSQMNSIVNFDAKKGIIRAQSGVSIADILSLVVQHGWFVPVTPGTKFVTLGGALANDVHGKNHHIAGSFGCHVRSFELIRSSGERLVCSPGSNSSLFSATIGGMGLTGLITWIEIQLIAIGSAKILMDRKQVSSINEMISALIHADEKAQYTVGWIDTTSGDNKLGRGVMFKGIHATKAEVGEDENTQFMDSQYSANQANSIFSVVPKFGQYFLNAKTIFMFNSAYFQYNSTSDKSYLASIDSFFYPLDKIPKWNRIYGATGMLQYQFVVPMHDGKFIVQSVLKKLRSIRASSFLSVLKVFGDIGSPGMMSFPMPGVTLSLDIPAGIAGLLPTLDFCDEMIAEVGGRIYAAKDSRMRGSVYRKMYPRLEEFCTLIDPQFSSSFWRRVAR